MLAKLWIVFLLIVLHSSGTLAGKSPNKKSHRAAKKQDIIYSADDEARRGGDANELLGKHLNSEGTLEGSDGQTKILDYHDADIPSIPVDTTINRSSGTSDRNENNGTPMLSAIARSNLVSSNLAATSKLNSKSESANIGSKVVQDQDVYSTILESNKTPLKNPSPQQHQETIKALSDTGKNTKNQSGYANIAIVSARKASSATPQAPASMQPVGYKAVTVPIIQKVPLVPNPSNTDFLFPGRLPTIPVMNSFAAQGANGIPSLVEQNPFNEIPRSMVIPGYQAYMAQREGSRERSDLEGFAPEDAYRQSFDQGRDTGEFQREGDDLSQEQGYEGGKYRELGQRRRFGRLTDRFSRLPSRFDRRDEDYEDVDRFPSFNEEGGEQEQEPEPEPEPESEPESETDYNSNLLRAPHFHDTFRDADDGDERSFGRMGPIEGMGSNYQSNFAREIAQQEPFGRMGPIRPLEGIRNNYQSDLEQEMAQEDARSTARSFGRLGAIRPYDGMESNYQQNMAQEIAQEDAQRRSLESQREMMLDSAIAQQKREQRLNEEAELAARQHQENRLPKETFYPEQDRGLSFDSIDHGAADNLQMKSFSRLASDELYPNNFKQTNDLQMTPFSTRDRYPVEDQNDARNYLQGLKRKGLNSGQNFDFFPFRRHHRRHRHHKRRHMWNQFNEKMLPFQDYDGSVTAGDQRPGVLDSRFSPISTRPRSHSAIEPLTPAQAQYMEGKFSDNPSTLPMFTMKSKIPKSGGFLKNIDLEKGNIILKINGHFLEDTSELRSKILDGRFEKGMGKLIKSKGPIKIKVSHANDAKHSKIVDIISTSLYRVWDTRNTIARQDKNNQTKNNKMSLDGVLKLKDKLMKVKKNERKNEVKTD